MLFKSWENGVLHEASKNILMLCVKPSVKIWRYCFSESSWFGHLFSIKVNLSQASYRDSISPCLKFWISIFLSQYFDIRKYFSKNFSSSSSHVWMVPLGMANNQSLALSCQGDRKQPKFLLAISHCGWGCTKLTCFSKSAQVFMQTHVFGPIILFVPQPIQNGALDVKSSRISRPESVGQMTTVIT